MTVLTQINVRRGVVERVPRGPEPVVELYLEPGEYIVAFDLREAAWVGAQRKTVDWKWQATIATPLGQDPTAELHQLAEAAVAR